MSAENETLADIESEIRARAGAWPDEKLKEYDLRLADRIKTAAKRECGNIAKMREVLCGARAMAVGSVNCGGGEPWNRLVEEIDAALAAKPRVCDVYAAKDLKMIVYSEMGRYCMEGRLSKDCLEITKAVADSVIDGMTAEMKDDGEEQK